MTALHVTIRRALANRHSPEAAEIFKNLLGFVERRVGYLARTRCRGLIEDADLEEVIGEVLYQLMEGGLGRFRGETIGELNAYVRTIADRTTLRRAQRRLRERDTVADLAVEDDTNWQPTAEARPDDAVDWEPNSPLDVDDQAYLADLIYAGSKAELARRRGVSRAAVTQRVSRILTRVDALGDKDRSAHDAWMHRVANNALWEASFDS